MEIVRHVSLSLENFDFSACLSKNVVKHGVERKACSRVANAFLRRSELTWPVSRLKISKMSKNCIFGKMLLESPITPKNVFHLMQSLYGIRKTATKNCIRLKP